MGVVFQPQLVMMILKLFKDQFGSTWTSKLLWIFRRLMFFMRSWFFDVMYYSVNVDDLIDALSYWRKYVLENIEYLPEVFDCDDFATYFKVWLQSWIYASKGIRVNGVGIALGVVYKDGRLLGGHAWNIVLVDNGGRQYVLFVEPQLGEIITSNNISSDGWKYELQAVIM